MAAVERYWVANLRRDELLDIIQRKGNQYLDGVPDPSFIRPSVGKVAAIWRSESESERSLLPQVIVGDSQSLEDLWAWAFTYLRGLGPLTSQVRVLTPVEYQSVQKRERAQRHWRYAGGLVGMVLGEAFVQMGLQSNEEVGLVACRSTLSFVLARASALGMSIDELK